MMKSEYLEQPCRNFCFFKSILFNDPKDGKEKVALSSFVAGGTGEIVFLDPHANTGETHVIPGDNGAWALLNYNDEKLFVGTCGRYGYLHCMDLEKREWLPSLRVDGISYIWDLALGADGKIYGGTYPGCVLLQYDPQTHTLINKGPLTKDEDNLYSRLVFATNNEKVFVNCGMSSTCIGVYDIKTDTMDQIMPNCSIAQAGDDYLYINTPKGQVLVRPDNLQPFEDPALIEQINFVDERWPSPCRHVLPLKNTMSFGLCGQQYFLLGEKDEAPTFYDIPTEAPPTEIFAMTSDDEGVIYGTTGLGQTMFSYMPKDGSYWNSDIVTERGGEVYGIVAHQGLIYMTSYSGGDHMVYDPQKPWNQRENINPKTLKRIGPDYIRPQARSFLGKDDNVWTGWIAQYGTYGCAISKIDTKTHEVSNFTNLVEGQGIGAIAGDDAHIYFTTNGSGNGLKQKKEPFYLVKMRMDGEILEKVEFPLDVHLYALHCYEDRLRLFTYENSKSLMRIYDTKTMECLSEESIPFGPMRMVGGKQGELVVVARIRENDQAGHAIMIVDDETFTEKRRIPIDSSTASVTYNTKDGYIYYAQHTKLYRTSYPS